MSFRTPKPRILGLGKVGQLNHSPNPSKSCWITQYYKLEKSSLRWPHHKLMFRLFLKGLDQKVGQLSHLHLTNLLLILTKTTKVLRPVCSTFDDGRHQPRHKSYQVWFLKVRGSSSEVGKYVTFVPRQKVRSGWRRRHKSNGCRDFTEFEIEAKMSHVS